MMLRPEAECEAKKIFGNEAVVSSNPDYKHVGYFRNRIMVVCGTGRTYAEALRQARSRKGWRQEYEAGRGYLTASIVDRPESLKESRKQN